MWVMDVILIPGFWLDGSSWGPIPDGLRAAGHTVHTPTLPGLESIDADRAGISLRDHVDTVVALIDQAKASVTLVGHSGGGAIAWAAADARPDRVARIAYVDSGPLGDGDAINADLPGSLAEIPLPEWSVFGEAELADMDDDLRARIRAQAVPQPVRVATDPQRLSHPARYHVPSTVITCTFPGDTMRQMITDAHPFVAELARVDDYEIVDLPTGHWPQFTKPLELQKALLNALR